MKRLCMVFAVALGLAGSDLLAQVGQFADEFDEDPCQEGGDWDCRGATKWIDPILPDCGPDTEAPDCNIYPGTGYVLITPAIGNQGGHMFRREPFFYDNFRLTATVELRDGSIGRPADGMAIVIVGSPVPPAPGALGGALGATGLGMFPTMIFEFDNWSCNGAADRGDDNHVAFAYSANGFVAGEIPPMPADVKGSIGFKRVPVLLNNLQPKPAPPNRFVFQVQMKNDLVTCDIANPDVGMAKTRMYSYIIPDFIPFNGFLGVTGATGGAWQSQIIHSVEVEDITGRCLFPPATGTRSITNLTRGDTPPVYQVGDSMGVTVALTNIREFVDEDPDCFPPDAITITERLPAGWTATDVSPAPFSNNAGVIVWKLSGSPLLPVNLSYKTVAATLEAQAFFTGDMQENVAGAEVFGIDGQATYTGIPITSQGYITLWNHLGPLAWAFPAVSMDHGAPGACDANSTGDPLTPGGDLAVDWIQNEDESVTEANIAPFPGLITKPKYGGTGLPAGGARAAGLTLAAGDMGVVVQDSFPAWRAGLSTGGSIDHAGAEVNGVDAEDHVTVSCVYVTNTTGSDIVTTLGIGSDDSIQIFVNDVNVTEDTLTGAKVLAVCRGWGTGDQNTFPVTLKPGENRVLVKVSDGCCQSGFRLRFHDPESPDPLFPEGLMPPKISVSTESTANPRPGDVTRSFSTEAYALDQPVSVSLAVKMKAAGNVSVREAVPAGVTVDAQSISDGGILDTVAGVITWNLNNVQEKTLSYRLVADACARQVQYAGSTYTVGASEVLLSGRSLLTRAYQDDTELGAWTNTAIVASGGSAQKRTDHAISINGTGGGLKLSKDEFQFVSNPASGDYEISAAVTCLTDPGGRGIAGLMVRNTLADNSAHIFFGLGSRLPAGATEGGTLTGIFRRDNAKSTSLIPVADFTEDEKKVERLPIYLLIKKEGLTLRFSRRYADEQAFTQVFSRDIGLPTEPLKLALVANPFLGLAVSAATTSGGETLVNFADVSGPPFGTVVLPPGAPTLTQARAGNGQVDLAWTAPAGGTAPTNYVIFRDGVNVAELPATLLSYSDTGRTNGTQYCYKVRARANTVQSVDSNQMCATPVAGKLLRRGDLNTDQAINLTDAINLLGALFLGSPELITCRDAADVDDSGNLNLTDAIYLLSYSFQGGDEPPAPGPKICGLDPSADSPLPPVNGELGCLSEVICVSRP